MRKYEKPLMQVEKFALNEAVANGAGCYHVDATDPSSTKIYCVIGNQTEVVFKSCDTSATKYALIENYSGDDDYFIWYTYAGDGSSYHPSDTTTAFLAKLVQKAGYTTGSGWHYAKVDASSTAAFDTYTIS